MHSMCKYFLWPRFEHTESLLIPGTQQSCVWQTQLADIWPADTLDMELAENTRPQESLLPKDRALL